MNNILNTSFDTLYLFAGMVFVEYIISLILLAHRNMNLLRVFMAVLSGNAFTSLLCLFLPAGNSDFGYYTWLGIAFAITVLFEWVFYIAYFRDREFTASNSRFFFCSLIGNIVSFAAIALLQHFDILN